MSVRQLSVPKFSTRLSGYLGLVIAIVVVWGLGDAVSTLWAIEATGSVEGEANPWIKTLLAYDPALLVVLKTGVVACAGALLLGYREAIESVPGWRLWFLSVLAIGSAIVVGNVHVALTAIY